MKPVTYRIRKLYRNWYVRTYQDATMQHTPLSVRGPYRTYDDALAYAETLIGVIDGDKGYGER